MIIKCEYCDSNISDTQAQCPYCGATNKNMQRSGNGVPKTIDELKAYCQAKNMPLDKMRFFIGEDYRGARAYGIYKDGYTGNFIVYKNKSDGSRAIRYEGTDEAYAVNEIYQKIKEETLKQANVHARNNYQGNQHGYSMSPSRMRSRFLPKLIKNWIISLLFIIISINIVMPLIFKHMLNTATRQVTNYYSYDDSYYRMSNDDWYIYDSINSTWLSVDTPDWEDTSDAYKSSYSSFCDEYDIEPVYNNNDDDSYYNNDYDNDSWDNDYDYDDWDSDYGDWDSDW